MSAVQLTEALAPLRLWPWPLLHSSVEQMACHPGCPACLISPHNDVALNLVVCNTCCC